MNQGRLIQGLRNALRRTYFSFRDGRHRPAWRRYLCATFWVGIGTLADWTPLLALDEELRLGFYFAAVLLTAWGNGAGPGAWALGLSLVPIIGLAKYQAPGPSSLWVAAILSYIVPSILGILIIESFYRTRCAAEAEAARRRQAEAALEIARRQIHDYSVHLERTVSSRTSELNEALGFLERFCHSIAHELRAPLRAISGFGQVIVTEHSGTLDAEARECFQKMREASRRMDRLIVRLLELGAFSHQALQLRKVDLRKAVNEALAAVHSDLQAVGASVKVADDLGNAFGDAALLRRIVCELLANAIQFRKPGAALELQISASRQEYAVALCIRDNGIGVDKLYHEKIFGTFQTLQPANPEHVGVGLAIVSKAIERLHGSVRVESAPGCGTAFWLELPRRDWRGDQESSREKDRDATPVV